MEVGIAGLQKVALTSHHTRSVADSKTSEAVTDCHNLPPCLSDGKVTLSQEPAQGSVSRF